MNTNTEHHFNKEGPNMINWGTVRGAIHGQRQLKERLSIISNALRQESNEHELLRHYISSHLPNWDPRNNSTPYEVLKHWMYGEHLDILGVYSNNSTLINTLRSDGPNWKSQYLSLRNTELEPAISLGDAPIQSLGNIISLYEGYGKIENLIYWAKLNEGSDQVTPTQVSIGEWNKGLSDHVLNVFGNVLVQWFELELSINLPVFENASLYKCVIEINRLEHQAGFEYQVDLYSSNNRMPEPVSLFLHVADLYQLEPKLGFERSPGSRYSFAKTMAGIERMTDQMWRAFTTLTQPIKDPVF